MKKKFIILDFGSQYTWLLARSLRELGYYSEVVSFDTPTQQLKNSSPQGFILSGGPHSVFSKNAPRRSIKELSQIAPCLGICYGMQLICHELGGHVKSLDLGTYGSEQIEWKEEIIPGLKKQKVWMSHGDSVQKIPPSMKLLASSHQGFPVALKNNQNNIWCFQFHPEVHHTECGKKLLLAFTQEACQAPPGNWNVQSMLQKIKADIKETLPQDQKVLCALSGGVDSTVTALLLTQILGPKKVPCFFVDTGLLRQNEFEEVLENYKKLNLNVRGLKSQDLFLKALQKVVDPEQKRKVIGHTFIEVFKKYKDPDTHWLAQGTLYPDVIESFSHGLSSTIKSHHNVGGLPQNLGMNLLEPLRYLFKDEVRNLGQKLGLEEAFLNRHPFPGPGLAIRIMGEVTKESISILQKADAIFIEEIKKHNLYSKIWQAFCVLLSNRSVGVQGDLRTYEKSLALRAVTSTDGMTADWYPFSHSFLKSVSNKITNQIRQINRVVYDVTSKPPGTIEWE